MRFAGLIVAVFALLLAPAFAQSQSAEQLWQSGAAAFDNQNYRAAYTELLPAAQMGHARAQALLGIMFQDGDGVPQDDRQAAHWFWLAARQGHRAAQYALGGMYEEGEGGLPKDVAKAAQLYQASAAKGYDKAQFAIGLSYEFGEGVPRNRQQAIYWLSQAASQGEGRAGWIAQWLRRPNTPEFANEAQLGTYIAQTIQHYYARQYGGNPNVCSAACAGAAHDAEVRNNLVFRSYIPPWNPP